MPDRIYCFQHCDNHKNIFSFELSANCPICNEKPDSYIVDPYYLPSPFNSPKDNPCCIVMRPSYGDFLNDYHKTVGLHLGLTDLNGKVYEFDNNGLSCERDPDSWKNCLIVDIVNTLIGDSGYNSDNDLAKNELGLTRDIINHNWHIRLSSLGLHNKWTASSYNCEDNNCYNFVLSFFKLLEFSKLCHSLDDKTKFCQDFLLPKTRLVARYISLYRKMKKNDGVFICDTF